ncbi:MAG: hypothetical protein MZV63_10705 [Marinilabiliales bacterium]|nr:hypothetical protein [Marinilabiliales bacterium]
MLCYKGRVNHYMSVRRTDIHRRPLLLCRASRELNLNARPASPGQDLCVAGSWQ